ncbi:MAG: hypothetical protein K5784_03280 [Clostridiales bacterium]|nr:hypothetical protein [Clostridiales bacterium]
MKKTVLIILALLLALSAAFAEQPEQQPPQQELGEGDILMHGYIDPVTRFYIGVPAEWSIVGPGSTAANLAQATEELESIDAYGLFKSFNESSRFLLCVSPDNKGLVVTYGASDGASNQTFIDAIDSIKAQFSTSISGLTFNEESGKYALQSSMEILYLSMTYKNTEIRQYYLVSGDMYIFTFFGVDKILSDTIMSTFSFSQDK